MKLFIQNHQILALWIGMFLINASGIAALFYWAVHTKQLSDRDHGRYLALEADPEIKPDGDCRGAGEPGAHERHGGQPPTGSDQRLRDRIG